MRATDCPECHGTKSHSTSLAKAGMCPLAYKKRLERHTRYTRERRATDPDYYKRAREAELKYYHGLDAKAYSLRRLKDRRAQALRRMAERHTRRLEEDGEVSQ